jgi:natural product biosynthesis luciferase-like monooxygenase protein
MPETVTNPVIDHYPLSPLQHGMLFHYVQSGGETGVDIEQLEGRLHERVDEVAFSRAWAAIAARHPVLRTRFRWEGLNVPQQEVLASISTPVQIRDLSPQSASEQAEALAAFLEADRRLGFNLSEAPLWRLTLFRLSADEYRMVWTYSHAILDSSFAEVLREAFGTYEALLQGATLPLDDRPAYRDHILWLQEDLRRRSEEIKAFWRARLAGFDTPTNLEAVQVQAARPESAPGGHDTLHFRIPLETSGQIRQMAAEQRVRVSTYVAAAWALVLRAFSGQDDVVFGSTRACRRSSIPGADAIVGLFINTVPVRAQAADEMPLREFLHGLRQDQQALRPFENTPLVDVLSCAAVPRGTPLFETIIVFNDAENDARLKSFGDRWAARSFELHDQTNFPMNVMAYDGPELSFKLSYERRRFERASVERIASLLTAILEAMAAKPGTTLSELPRLPADDLRLLRTFNETRAAIPRPMCIHEAFEAQVDRTPDAVAVVFRGRSLTYRELDERANRVARELVSLGVGPDQMIGVFVERSLEMVIGLLAILKAGGAYVPMDPAYPRERVAWMLEDTEAPVVLTLDRLRAALPPTGATVLALDAFGNEGTAQRLGRRATGDNLAYVIFTSGSTGRPKGVQIEHRNVANFFAGMDAVLGTTPGVWLALTSISFDISVLEIFWTLARGFTVVVQEEAESVARAARPKKRTRPIGFSLFYFAADAAETGNKYRLLLDGAKFADAHGFEAIWTPERHFHPFGGLYPNPSVTSAAIAVVTSRIGIRAGSVVLPLHSPIRCAEEWSVVDNLSNGRVGLSFASGWHASDFALAPANFKERRELMSRGIETVRALWRGESVAATSGDGKEVQVRMYPPPVQREPRIWITASGNPDTFAAAGRMGACVLTNLLVMKTEELVSNVAVYRKEYREAGHPGEGHVTLMLHTFVGRTLEEVRAKVKEPFLQYLRTSTDLINKARWELTAFAKADDRAAAGAAAMNLDDLSPEDMNAILDHAFERYFATAGLFGTPEGCLATVDRLRDLGVDEIACLIDFGIDADTVLASLPQLDELRRRSAPIAESEETEDYTIPSQIRRGSVTHLQCTPSLLGALALDDETAEAIGTLKTLLVGGEPLPTALVERLRPQFPGRVLNMYGPTETTIWSTSSPVVPGGRITLGKPIANTTIHIVDRRQRPLPIGVPGELLIGGAGVVRGYLARPELTEERFIIANSQADHGERLYRTGDLARWLPTGDIEFLGRLDHQTKIRGYRIELGEIESVIGEHPSVRETVVVAREDAGTDARLVAYIVPRKSGEAGGTNIPSNWEAIWDETYKGTTDKTAGFNTAGWNSSYTGLPIPETEIHQWADFTVERVLKAAVDAQSKPRVLEIGCGTGMMLFRIAPHCERYVGVDFSGSALAYIGSQLDAQGLGNVSLERLAADGLGQLTAPGPFDMIVINSVIQYFPDADYLVGVLRAAYERLAPGGTLFVGDVRSRQHLATFHAAIEVARSDDASTIADLQMRVRRRAAEEGELVVDPELFELVAQDLSDASVERAEIKAGRARNEMTDFRYDVILRRRGGSEESAPTPPTVACPEPCSTDSIRALLRDEPPSLRVAGIRNSRLASPVRMAQLVASGAVGPAVVDLRAALGEAAELDPEDIRTLDARYEAVIEFSRESPDLVDVTFRHRTKQPRLARVARGVAGGGPAARYANTPCRPETTGAALIPALRDAVRRTLPEYMVPAAWIVMEALPTTPNGKIDRRALPPPERPQSKSTTQEPPKNDIERGIVSVLRELLGGGDVGVDDNFFDLGANSLMMVQASVRLRSLLGHPVPLVRMFQHQTARLLAAALGDTKPEANRAVKQSQDRAQIRMDAMRKLRGDGRTRR